MRLTYLQFLTRIGRPLLALLLHHFRLEQLPRKFPTSLDTLKGVTDEEDKKLKSAVCQEAFF